jgi:hypothetical protein
VFLFILQQSHCDISGKPPAWFADSNIQSLRPRYCHDLNGSLHNSRHSYLLRASEKEKDGNDC